MDKRSLCRVVVKFREAGAGPLALLQEILSLHPGTELRRLFTSVDTATISRWVNKARQSDPGYRAPDFSTYYGISCPAEIRTDHLVQQLDNLNVVEFSYIESGMLQPPGAEPLPLPGSRQGYLNPAPEGINAHYAWQLTGGRGAGIRFVDIEQGWQQYHEALELRTLPLTGVNAGAYASHGTAVLGVLTLQPNDAGGLGLAPDAAGYIISQWRPDGTFNTADAIMTAIGHLQPGDILLLEAQTFHTDTVAKTWPVETHEACFQAIRLAGALGIIVIEPAGNGSTEAPEGNDLDLFVVNGRPVFDPLSDQYLDSGAILVGAGSCTVPHTRMPWSNYGRRVNCYAWGEQVYTAGSYPHSSGIAINTYTGAFGGTSAAAAIIAGAAILLQSITEANHRFRLNPRQMRSLLGSDNLGTPSARGSFADKIGVMPNLQKIIDTF